MFIKLLPFYILILSFKTFGVESKFTHPAWCKLTTKREVGPYLKVAAEYVDFDPVLLAIGMAGEGFSQKDECVSLMIDAKESPNDKYLQAEVSYACDPNPNRIEANKILPLEIAKTKVKQEVWDKIKNKIPPSTEFAQIDPEGELSPLSYKDAITIASYGYSRDDDGTDTFCLEYSMMKEKKYLPSKFSASNANNIKDKSFSGMPDFIFLTDADNRNENATYRFNTNKGPYMERMGMQKNPRGDKGETLYKTPEAQAFANAALWKHSEDKFNSAIKELIKKYKSKGPSSSDYQKGLILERPFSKTEKAFWIKTFFNGGQGTQAAAWNMLKRFAENKWLINDAYLYKNPGVVNEREVYINARITADTYAEITKTSDCQQEINNLGKKFSVEDYKSTKSSQSLDLKTENNPSGIIK